MYLSDSSLVVDNIWTELFICCCLKQSCILDVISASQKVYFSSHISEVVNNVHIFISCLPMRRESDLHFLKIKALLPVNTIFVACDNWDSPGVLRVSLCTEGEDRIVGLIFNIVWLISTRGKWIKYRVIVWEHLHVHHGEYVRFVVVEDHPSYLNCIFTNKPIKDWQVWGALPGPLIMCPVCSGPRAGTEPGQRAVLIMNYLAPGFLIADLDRHIIEGQSGWGQGTSSWVCWRSWETMRTGT